MENLVQSILTGAMSYLFIFAIAATIYIHFKIKKRGKAYSGHAPTAEERVAEIRRRQLGQTTGSHCAKRGIAHHGMAMDSEGNLIAQHKPTEL